MHFENSRIDGLLPLWFSSSNDLNDWNGAQRWNVWNGLRYQMSEAADPFDKLRAGFWNDWNRPRY